MRSNIYEKESGESETIIKKVNARLGEVRGKPTKIQESVRSVVLNRVISKSGDFIINYFLKNVDKLGNLRLNRHGVRRHSADSNLS